MSKPNCFFIYSFLLLSLFTLPVLGEELSTQSIKHNPLFKQGRYNELFQRYTNILEEQNKNISDFEEKTPSLDAIESLFYSWLSANLNLADLLSHEGDYDMAEMFYKQALEWSLDREDVSLTIQEKYFVNESLGHAELYFQKRLFSEAIELYLKVIDIQEEYYGPDHLVIAKILADLGIVYGEQARYREADSVFKRALSIYEKNLGPNHPDLARTLGNLSIVYARQNRHREAELLQERVLFIAKSDPDLHENALALNNLAYTYLSQFHYTKAEPLLKTALSIYEKNLGPNHIKSVFILDNLGTVYGAQARYREAESHFKKALRIIEKNLPPNHPDLARTLVNFSIVYRRQNRHKEAESLLQKALSIIKIYPNHPFEAILLQNLAGTNAAQNQIPQALNYAQKATTILKKRHLKARQNPSPNTLTENKGYRSFFTFHLNLLTKHAKNQPSEKYNSTQLTFELSQLASRSTTAEALSQMATRFSSGDSTLVKLLRERQNVQKQMQYLDNSLSNSFSLISKKDNYDRGIMLKKLALKEKKIQQFDIMLDRQFPQYQELTNPKPLQIKDVQKLLNIDEALISYLVDSQASYLWVVRKDKVSMHRIELSAKDVNKKVRYLRQHLDPSGISTLDQMPPFAVKEAHELYQDIFLPALPLLQGIKHLIIVPDGPLQKLPFGVLVTSPYEEKLTDPKSHRAVPWLAKDYALTVLPAVSSLRALRSFAKKSSGSEPFIGFGDPTFSQEKRIPIKFAALFSRGAIANAEEVRKFQSLPETADELYSIAQTLNAPSSNVYLRERATEHKVRTMDLTPYRTIAFATHGLMAGEFTGFTEPALVLTPPQKGTEKDDGLLTASEIAQLDLNADWVILSACNTAAGDSPSAEGLTGLAKAFFYAGTRTLLVSHWSVFSNASTALTTQLFNQLRNNPSIGKSEALRRSMLTLMNSNEETYYAHPMAWAPFIVVGEGL